MISFCTIYDTLYLLLEYKYGILYKDGAFISDKKEMDERDGSDIIVQTPKMMEEHKAGMCHDATIYLDKELTWLGIPHKCIYIASHVEPMLPTHSFIAAYDDQNSVWAILDTFSTSKAVYDKAEDMNEAVDKRVATWIEKDNGGSPDLDVFILDHMPEVPEGGMGFVEFSEKVVEAASDYEFNLGYIHIEYEGTGVYQALKKSMPLKEWKKLLADEDINWLPKPPDYSYECKSYFTIEGYREFKKRVLPIVKQHLDEKKLSEEYVAKLPKDDIVYSDEFQVVVRRDGKTMPSMKFESTFNRVFATAMNSIGLLGTDADDDGYVNISPMLFQNLVFEAVIQQDLYPIPKAVLDFICAKVRTRKKNSIKIAYDELFKVMDSSGYEDAFKFKESLGKLLSFDSGYLQIGVCSDTYEDFAEFFKSPEMNDERLMNFWQSCRNDVSGNTFSGDPLLMAKFKNACIFLNIEHIKAYSSWKDTLSHELTHFIHRVVSFNNVNAFSKIEKANMMNPQTGLQFLSTDVSVDSKFYKMFDELFKDTKMKCSYLASLYKNTLYFREEHTTIQNILNGFQRMYEQQNVKNDKPVYASLETGHDAKKYEEQRLSWLYEMLNSINEKDFFRNDGKWVIDEFLSSPHQKLTSPWKYQQKFKNAIIILQYIGVKTLIPEYRIDERLIQHFKTFKFRDN